MPISEQTINLNSYQTKSGFNKNNANLEKNFKKKIKNSIRRSILRKVLYHPNCVNLKIFGSKPHVKVIC